MLKDLLTTKTTIVVYDQPFEIWKYYSDWDTIRRQTLYSLSELHSSHFSHSDPPQLTMFSVLQKTFRFNAEQVGQAHIHNFFMYKTYLIGLICYFILISNGNVRKINIRIQTKCMKEPTAPAHFLIRCFSEANSANTLLPASSLAKAKSVGCLHCLSLRIVHFWNIPYVPLHHRFYIPWCTHVPQKIIQYANSQSG